VGGVVTEIGLPVRLCVEEVLKLEPRPVLTLSHDLAEKTVLERVPTPETATHIPVKVFNISPYEPRAFIQKISDEIKHYTHH